MRSARPYEAVRAITGKQSLDAAGSWPAPPARGFARELAAGFQEFGGKLTAYYLVRIRAQRQAARGTGDLASLVAGVYRREPRHTAFLLERLCYDFVRRFWRAGTEPRRLLDGAEARHLPAESLILLHAGLGMALAEHLLRPLRPDSSEAAFDAALGRFAELVSDNARPELAPVTCEAMGLMVRRFLPGLHAAVAARMRARDPGLAAYYWHGAGRAIYFLARLFHPFPGSPRKGLEICRREPPEPRYRLDALAGYCFASTMINLRHPEVVAGLLPHLAAGEAEPLASGVTAALITRDYTCPGEPAVRRFLRPSAEISFAASAGELAAAWEEVVRRPGAEAMDRLYPWLRARGKL
ncbi:MAG TPA: hypothetical protein VE075_04820, partial [Thermoanaerobaculia bacterium]|nr:hypothetical protein [Thermoanaerobaculia bacterium]